MTTVDLRSWAPRASSSASPLDDLVTTDDLYTGKHRTPGIRTLSVLRMAYRPRHRAR